MDNLIKIGHTFINLTRILTVEDRFAAHRENTVLIRFDSSEAGTLTFSGREADDLRTWLNSRAVNLHEATDLDTAG